MKSPEFYLSLPYTLEVVEEDGSVTISIPDLPGCASYGDTYQEAREKLREIQKLWIQNKIALGQTVPEPSGDENYSGKFVLRIPKGLHRSLDLEARKQSTSLNQYLVHLLSERHAIAAMKENFDEFVRSAGRRFGEFMLHGGSSLFSQVRTVIVESGSVRADPDVYTTFRPAAEVEIKKMSLEDKRKFLDA